MKKNSILLLTLMLLITANVKAGLVTLSESFDATTFLPTGWTLSGSTTSVTWARRTSSAHPSGISPKSGAGMAQFNSWSVSSGSRSMITPAYDLSGRGTATPTVSLWVYREDGFYPSTADKIDVYINTTASVSGGTLLGTINRAKSLSPTQSSDGWYQYTFNVPSTFNGSTNYLLIQGTSAYGNDIHVDDVSWDTYSNACSGTPTPGNTNTTAGLVCTSTQSFTLSLNPQAGTGLTYQWQTSSNGTTWSNVSTGGTSATYTTTQSASTYYRCAVTCTNSGNTGNSNPVQVISTAACYCIPSNTNGCVYDDDITNVTLNTLNNSSNSSGCSTQYTDYGGSAGITTLGLGITYPIRVSVGPGGTETVGVWIDYDHSNTFDASEFTYIGSGSSSSPLASNIAIPATALTGYTKMRVRVQWSTAVASGTACSTYSYGETEDYDVNIQCVVEVTTQPTNKSVCSGSGATFNTVVRGYGTTYQWQESTNGGVSWTNLSNTSPYSGVTTNTLGISTVATAMNNNQYRCTMGSTCGTTNTTNAALLTLNSNPIVGTQPASTTTCANSTASFTMAATGGILTYQWQVSTDAGVSWTNLTNSGSYSTVTTTTLNLTNTPLSFNNNQYRCVTTNGCFTTNTNAATLTVNPNVAITGSPVSTTICPTGNASFTGAASGLSVTYQWQVSTNGGSTWSNLSNGAPYSNVTTTTLNITGAAASLNGNQYRMVASSSVCGVPVNTTAATLTVNTFVTFTQQPVNITACEGSAAVFTLSALSTGLVYQWQESTNGTTWTNLTNVAPYSGTTTNTLSVIASIGMYNNQYRCLVSSSCALPTASTIATLFVKTLPTITAQPVNSTVCDGRVTTSAGVFTVGTTGSNLTYQWQVSTNGGSTWSNAAGSPYLNPTTNTLTVSNPLPSFSGYQYRVVVSGYCTPSVTSTAAILTVNTRPIITTQPTNSLICQGDNATFTVVAAATGIVYQWQSYNASTSSWSNLTNSSAYSNVNTATLTVTAPAFNTNGANSYRCVISGTCTPPVTTNGVYHFISTPPTITYQPIDAAGCIGGTATFTTTASATTPSNTCNYQWQVDNGTGFVNITNGAPYSGATNSILKITGVTLSMDGYQYRCIVSTSCGAPVTSAKAKLVTQGLPTITAQPTNTTVCPGTNTTITIGATGSTLAYQWQVNTGSGFVNIATSNPLYAGAKAAGLVIPSPTPSMNNYTYRCVVSGFCTPAVTSNSMTLKVYNPVVIASQTIADTICETSEKKIGLKASGNALIYQWQQLSSTPGLYTDLLNVPPYSGTNTDSLRFTNAPASLNGNVYRCRVTEKILCNLNFYTNDIPLAINPAPISTPPSITAQNLGTASFSVPNVGTKFQWQENAQNTGFFDITDPTHFDGINTSTLAIKDIVVGMSGNQYRCIVDGVCVTPVASKPSTLSVDNGVGIKQMTWSDVSMTVYPNPLSGTQLNIGFSKSMKGKTDVRVLDKLGKLVYEGTITPGQNNTASIELQALAAGVYLLQVNNEEGKFSQTVRFTKQ